MTTRPATDRPPRGPEAVSAALLVATERLCNEHPPGSVTVRQIAAEAGVNHGLVHHYFASKHALLAATMLGVDQESLTLIAAVADPVEAVGRFFDEVSRRPTYPRLLSWMLHEGIDPLEALDAFPLVDHLVDVIGTVTGRSHARLHTQALLAFVAGWASTADFMGAATGLSGPDRKRSSAWGRAQAIAIAFGSS